MFDRVVIAGVGLIGGSLGMDLRERRLARRVVGLVRREVTIREALAVGAVDEATLDPEALPRLSEGDLVVLATPVLTMPPLVRRLAPALASGALVTDAASTKAYLVRALPPLLPPGVEFIGGHPMAGSERGGVRHARRGLFHGARWVLTPDAQTSPEALAQLEALARAVEAEPLRLDPELHDAVVARISHLPHVVAAALATAAGPSAAGPDGDLPLDLLRRLAASGFRSTTRVADGPAPVWRDICLSNREALLASLDRFEAALAWLREAITTGDGEALSRGLEAAREARAQLVSDPGRQL
ncbi:MAG: prephenate dehydrogenase [Armatimonadetes bacterium]|nr:prephenate dehydrogenase [Armatimonadota bacterium]